MKRIVLRKKEEILEFLEDHCGEIKGLYSDTYYLSGGHNGTLDAIRVVEKHTHTKIEPDDEDLDLCELLQEAEKERR